MRHKTERTMIDLRVVVFPWGQFQAGSFPEGVVGAVGSVLSLFGRILFIPLLMQITKQNILFLGYYHLFGRNVHRWDVNRGSLGGRLHAILRVEQREVFLIVAGEIFQEVGYRHVILGLWVWRDLATGKPVSEKTR